MCKLEEAARFAHWSSCGCISIIYDNGIYSIYIGHTAALFCGGSQMENVKVSTNAEQQHESKVNEAENFDTFMKAMVQVVEKYGRFVLQELDCVA
jgi:hypothetical protein